MNKMFELLGIIVFVIVINATFSNGFGEDDTDPIKGRSGLGLYIDNKTGCHYLSGGILGGIHPRLDEKGNHICDKNIKEKSNE